MYNVHVPWTKMIIHKGCKYADKRYIYVYATFSFEIYPSHDQYQHVLRTNGILRIPRSVRLKLSLCKNNFARHDVYLEHILGLRSATREINTGIHVHVDMGTNVNVSKINNNKQNTEKALLIELMRPSACKSVLH